MSIRVEGRAFRALAFQGADYKWSRSPNNNSNNVANVNSSGDKNNNNYNNTGGGARPDKPRSRHASSRLCARSLVQVHKARAGVKESVSFSASLGRKYVLCEPKDAGGL